MYLRDNRHVKQQNYCSYDVDEKFGVHKMFWSFFSIENFVLNTCLYQDENHKR